MHLQRFHLFIFIVLAWILNPYFSFGCVIHLLAHFVPHTVSVSFVFGIVIRLVFGDSVAFTFKIFISTFQSKRERTRTGRVKNLGFFFFRSCCCFETMAIIKCNATAHKTILKIAVAKENCSSTDTHTKNNQPQCNNVKLVQQPSTTTTGKKLR